MSAAPDPAPLLHPRSVAVVGANERAGSYGDVIFRNLAAAGFEGAVYGVNPKRDEVHGKPCVPTVADLPEPVDAVVVAIPAAACAPVLIEAGERGCGGAIVLAAGFGETAAGRPLEDELRAAARVAGIPVCGPNGNGVVSVAARAPLWGDSVERLTPGPVAVITQSGNFGVNALGSDRGLGFHTVVSTGNSAVLEPSDWLEALAATEGVGSIALMLESDGDGARLARALATCAEREIGVAVLKVGSSEGGARAAGAHTGALAGDQRVFAALLEEAGAAQATEPGELLELARALAVPAARPIAARRARDPHLLGRGLGDGGRPRGGAGAGAAGAVAGGARAARGGAAERGDGRQSARLHLDALGRPRGARGGRRGGRPRTRRSTSCCCSSTSRAASTRRSPRVGKRSAGRCSRARREGTPRRSSPRPCPSCSTPTPRPS